MTKHAIPVAVLLLLAMGAPWAAPAAEGDGTVVAGELGAAIDALVQRETGGGFWGAILVARAGEVLIAKGYGFADYATTPNTPRTLFELASASKQFTAAAVFRLAQQGKLRTKDPLSRFFPKAPKDKAGITVRQLLTHTSGLDPEVGVPYASPVSRAEYVRTILAAPLATPPGTAFAYCNAGYALLAAIVEEVTGGSFEEYARKEVFARAGLEETGFIGDPALIASGRASVRLGGEPGTTAAKWFWGWGYRGMGGVVTTVLDLFRWDRALRGEKVLAAPAKEELLTPALAGYACGWLVEKTARGTTRAFHGGSVMGYGCFLGRYLEEDAFVAILSNGKTDVIALAAAVDKLLFPPPRITAVLDVSAYELSKYLAAILPASAVFTVAKEADGIVIRVEDGERVPVSIRAPKGVAAKLAADLEAALRGRSAGGGSVPPETEAGIYFSAYGPGRTRMELTEGLVLTVLPEYRGVDESGNDVVDRRVVFILDDVPNRQWPFMAKLGAAAADGLLAALRKALA